MEETVRKCDAPVGRKGNHCGEHVPDGKPFLFTVGGVEYAADLCDKHREAFRDAISVYVEVAHPVRTRNGAAVRAAIKGGKAGVVFTTKDVRTWLQAQGRDVPGSGRLSNALIEEYKAAHMS